MIITPLILILIAGIIIFIIIGLFIPWRRERVPHEVFFASVYLRVMQALSPLTKEERETLLKMIALSIREVRNSERGKNGQDKNNKA